MKKISTLLFLFLVAFTSKSIAQIDSTTLNAASITNVTTLNNNTTYILKGFTYVRNGGVLVIPAGTLILGDQATTGTLIIERGGKIIANGNENRPIVFTSRKPAGQRAPGDWGGIIILGRAPINTSSGADSAQIEGFPAGQGPWYGGQPVINNDSSGVLRYVRLEFPGVNLTGTAGNEINGLTTGGVGSRTVIEYVQVSYCGDDAFEFFGGNHNAKYLIAIGTVDDDFDCDNGHSGKIQFGLAIRDSSKSDVSGSHFWEIDNNNNNPANFNSPRTKTIFSNITAIGPKITNSTPINPQFQRGAHLRRNMLASIYNSVLTGYNVGIRFDGSGVYNAAQGDTIQIRNSVLSGFSTRIADTAGSTTFSPSVWLQTPSFTNRILSTPTDIQVNNQFAFYGATGVAALANVNWFVPVGGSPLLTGANFSNPNLAGFTTTTYVGAFGSNNNWLLSWSNFNPQFYTPQPNSITTNGNLIPNQFELSQNYPNPFNPSTSINFNIPTKGFVSLKIYDVTGKEVANLVNQDLSAGSYKYDFNASNLTSGIYFYTLTANNFRETKKMTLIK